MLDEAKPDFVFAFGSHKQQPAIAEALIARRVPFSIEKPCGTCLNDVRHVRRAAEAAGIFVSVPFHNRLGGLTQGLAKIAALPTPGLLSAHFRINAGSPLRHTASPWLTDPVVSGGGCLMNLGHHPIDQLLSITGSDVTEVAAQTSGKFLGLMVEDTAVVSLTLADGSLAVVEAGYTHPANPGAHLDLAVSLAHRDFTAARQENVLAVLHRDGRGIELIHAEWRTKLLFTEYVVETLRRAANSLPPVAGLPDLERTVAVIETAYRAAAEHSVVRLPEVVG